MTDPDGHQMTTIYNSSGQPTSSTDSVGNTTTYGYTGGLLASSTDPIGNTTSYVHDTAGRVIRSIDPLGNSSSNIFDNQNNLTQTINALGAATSFTYDAEHNRTAVTDANGGTTHYAYDSMNRLISATDPLGATEHYTYDANSRLAQFTDRRGKVSLFRYDEQNRKTFAGFGYHGSGYESTISYQYDQRDRLTQVVDSTAGTTMRTYDNFDNLIDEQTPQGEVTYSYDASRRLQTRTVVGETPVSYTWDNAGNPLSASQGGSSLAYAYDSAGRLSSMTLPNGVLETYNYDSDSRIAAITYSNASGPLGNLTYSYDPMGRVLTKGGSFASIVMPQSVSGNTFNAANEMTAFNGTPLAYDGNGNLLGDGTNSYAWDARNQLASLAGLASASFAYDALGQRVGQTITSAATQYLYDLANAAMPLQEFSSTGAPLLSGLGTSRADLSGTMTLLPDAQGDTIALTDATGAIQTQYSYGPFGAVSMTGAASTNPYQFQGMQNDATGMYYGAGVYYSPTFGTGVGGGLARAPASGSTSFATLSAPSSPAATPSGNGSCDKCDAKLEYGSVARLGFPNDFHAYWWVEDGEGSVTFSGEPENDKGAYGHLGLRTGVDPADGNFNKDEHYGPNSNCCNNDRKLRRAAARFPTYLMYNPTGPNSNSTARYLGDLGEFKPLYAPTLGIEAAGWEDIIQ
jgi:YD repeat-containing protein